MITKTNTAKHYIWVTRIEVGHTERQSTGASAEDKLTYAKALELAQALKAAAQEAKELSAGTPVAVHKVQRPVSPTTRSNAGSEDYRCFITAPFTMLSLWRQALGCSVSI